MNSSQQKLNDQQMQKLKSIETVYNKAIQKVATEGKFDYILEADAVKIGGEDVTDKVLKAMEASK